MRHYKTLSDEALLEAYQFAVEDTNAVIADIFGGEA